MSPWLHNECTSKEKTYRLSGVVSFSIQSSYTFRSIRKGSVYPWLQVCHRGTSGGGHYTCYNFNPVTELWYEFDDSLVIGLEIQSSLGLTRMLPKVRQVDLSTVLASEAYVLFYRKASEGELSESFSASDLFLTSTYMA